MRKFAILIMLMGILTGCSAEESETGTAVAGAAEEQTYPLEGRIISRDPGKNELTVDHEEIPGYMAAMTMPYQVRGQNVADLPADGTEITATVHATEEAYWISDVQPVGGAPTATDPTATSTAIESGTAGTDTTGTTDTAGTSTGAN